MPAKKPVKKVVKKAAKPAPTRRTQKATPNCLNVVTVDQGIQVVAGDTVVGWVKVVYDFTKLPAEYHALALQYIGKERNIDVSRYLKQN